MSNLFEYFVKSAAGYKPDSHMREGAYARAAAQSPGGIIRSSTIGHQGTSKRTAAQLRRTYNLPAPGQQPTGPDSHMREGAYARAENQSSRGVIRDTTSANPSPAPRPTAPQTQPATVAGASQANPGPASTGTSAPTSKPGSLAQTFAPYIPGVANWSNKAIRSAFARGSVWDSYRGMDENLDKAIQGHPDAQIYRQMSELGLKMHGDTSAQAGVVNTALQNLEALKYRDDVANYDPLGAEIAATQGVSPRATQEERALAARPYSYADARRQARPVMPRA